MDDPQKEAPVEEDIKTFVAPASVSRLDDRDKERVMAALSYAGILFVIPLFAVRRKSSFLQFHLRQGMVLFFVEAVFTPLPIVGWMLLVLPVIASLYGMLQAFSRREWQLPFLGKYAKRISL